jgi:hydrogenase maturation protein HypF
VVDCDPNPNLAESFGIDSSGLDRFTHHNGLRRSGATLELNREPETLKVAPRLWLLGGPPTEDALADAVARGIAGVLLAERFDAVVTDLGAGPELAETAVGGALNPADLCIVLVDGARVAEVTAGRIGHACERRRIRWIRVINRRGEPGIVAEELGDRVLATAGARGGAAARPEPRAEVGAMARVATPRAEGPHAAAVPPSRRRVAVRVHGTVQGVGFRPYVYRLAAELELGGFILNDERGVLLEAEGEPARVEAFLRRLPAEAPPLASVERLERSEITPRGEAEFEIRESERAGEPEALVSSDTATCAECLAELFDPADRRHRYPFTNCTNCGPRFTIVRDVPYDRPLTTMAGFQMCDLCRAEYEDPLDRRFHAQPNACPDCGPRAWIADASGREQDPAPHRDVIEAAAGLLSEGRVLAIKGVGGFHLVCAAADERAVAALRAAKHREDKPFALMAPSLEVTRGMVELSAGEEALISGPERPIVIARRRPAAAVAASVAPRSGDLGVMLPYSPLHHLLLHDVGRTLVMTSGNVSDEPIAYRDEDALERLGAIVDGFLLHDRPIETRTDDSVLRALSPEVRPRPLLLRRSRGYVPRSVELPVRASRPLLACGAELKSTFCVAKGTRAWISHHIGDLQNWQTLESFRKGIEHFERLFAITPSLVVHDLHPDYLSTRYALEREDPEPVAVQHHHAHLAGCLAEHGQEVAAVGAIYDGTGYGPDGAVWGGELLVGDLRGYERAGHMFPVRMPGGEAAIREPWRMLCAWLVAALAEERPGIPPPLQGRVDPRAWDAVCGMIASGISSPLTTSVGRLFDAVSALCGVKERVNYEGQAAAELEGLSDATARDGYPMPTIEARDEGPESGAVILDAREAVRAALDDVVRGAGPERVGGRFHASLACATASALIVEAERRGTDTAVLSGGVFQNRLLLERVAVPLGQAGMRVLVPERLPPNDGGIAYGQAAVAAARAA